MKRIILVIITVIVILGMVAGYMFRGVAPTPVAPANETTGAQSAFTGPTGAPSVKGPGSPPPAVH